MNSRHMSTGRRIPIKEPFKHCFFRLDFIFSAAAKSALLMTLCRNFPANVVSKSTTELESKKPATIGENLILQRERRACRSLGAWGPIIKRRLTHGDWANHPPKSGINVTLQHSAMPINYSHHHNFTCPRLF